MEKQEEKAVRRIKMEKWPISFSEWYEAYSAQIDESEEKNDSSKSKKITEKDYWINCCSE